MTACMNAYALLIDWIWDLLLQLDCCMCAIAQISDILLQRLLSKIIHQYTIELLDAFCVTIAVLLFILQLHEYGAWCVLTIPVHCMNSQSQHDRMRSIRPLHLWTMPLVTLCAVLNRQNPCPWVGMSLLCWGDVNSINFQIQCFRFRSASIPRWSLLH